MLFEPKKGRCVQPVIGTGRRVGARNFPASLCRSHIPGMENLGAELLPRQSTLCGLDAQPEGSEPALG